MNKFIAIMASILACQTLLAQKAIEVENDADIVYVQWNNSTAPHSNEETKDESWTPTSPRKHLLNTSECVFYVYLANKENATGQAVVCIPGGGYSKLCIDREGFAMAKYFQKIGITSCVLKYRLPNFGHKEVPLEDAQAALAYMRKNAKKFGFDPAKVGVCGGSAGGHLAAYVSNFAPDAEKPAFSILFYPVISGTRWDTHHGSFRYLLGDNRTPALQSEYSLENQVSVTTPPTLLLLSDDDKTVPCISSIVYYEALKQQGIKASMHIWPSGGHGWAGDESFKYWKATEKIMADWLKTL